MIPASDYSKRAAAAEKKVFFLPPFLSPCGERRLWEKKGTAAAEKLEETEKQKCFLSDLAGGPSREENLKENEPKDSSF